MHQLWRYLSLTARKTVNIGTDEDAASYFQATVQNQEEVPEKDLVLKLLLSQLKHKTKKTTKCIENSLFHVNCRQKSPWREFQAMLVT